MLTGYTFCQQSKCFRPALTSNITFTDFIYYTHFDKDSFVNIDSAVAFLTRVKSKGKNSWSEFDTLSLYLVDSNTCSWKVVNHGNQLILLQRNWQGDTLLLPLVNQSQDKKVNFNCSINWPAERPQNGDLSYMNRLKNTAKSIILTYGIVPDSLISQAKLNVISITEINRANLAVESISLYVYSNASGLDLSRRITFKYQ
jgi:hypothetical protein